MMNLSHTPRRTHVTTGAIGCAHDPYGYTKVKVIRGDRIACLYEDGLGRVKLTLLEHDEVVQEFEHIDGCCPYQTPADRIAKLKFAIRFRRHVGVSAEEATAEWYAMPDEPKIYM